MKTKEKIIYESPEAQIHEARTRSIICASILDTELNTSEFPGGEVLNF